VVFLLLGKEQTVLRNNAHPDQNRKKKMADILQTLELEFWCALIYPILV
jgi:hypothetical protein